MGSTPDRFNTRWYILTLLVWLLTQHSAVAQPRLEFAESYKKVWFADGTGTIGLRYRNTGNLPLVVTGAVLQQSSDSVFRFFTDITKVKTVAPGDSSYVAIESIAEIPFEYSCEVWLISNDPLSTSKKVRVRMNDSIPPNLPSILNTSPLKAGGISVAWSDPGRARDGDSVMLYKVYAIDFENKSEQLYTGRGRTCTAFPTLHGDMIISVIAYDDMGNKSVRLDTTWTDRTPPHLALESIDPQANGIPDHIARGIVPVTISVRDLWLKSYSIAWRELGDDAEHTIASFNFAPNRWPVVKTFDWNTSTLRGPKELILRAMDSVGNQRERVVRFQLTQVNGWPKRMRNSTLPSSITIATDNGGRFLLTGSELASGVFRPNGLHYYYLWPRDVARSTTDRIVTAAAQLNRSGGSEIVVGSREGEVLILDDRGEITGHFGSLKNDDRYVAIIQSERYGDLLLTGPSPVSWIDGDGLLRTAGVSQAWTSSGVPVELPALNDSAGVREANRYAVADLDRDGSTEVIALRDGGAEIGERLVVYDRNGAVLTSTYVWNAPTPYAGFYPSIGDLDGDGDLEIVVPAMNDSLYAFHHDGKVLEHYPVYVSTTGSGRNQALLADLDGDNAADIILPANDSIQCISGKRGMPMGGMWPVYRNAKGSALLTIGDLNSDGWLELVEPPQAVEQYKDSAWMYSYDLGVRATATNVHWGTFQHDMQRSGNYDHRVPELQSSVIVRAEGNTSVRQKGHARLYDALGRTLGSGAYEYVQRMSTTLSAGVYFLQSGASLEKLLIH